MLQPTWFKCKTCDGANAMEKSSWRRLLSYMCAQNCLPFLKHYLTVTMTNLLDGHFEFSSNYLLWWRACLRVELLFLSFLTYNDYWTICMFVFSSFFSPLQVPWKNIHLTLRSPYCERITLEDALISNGKCPLGISRVDMSLVSPWHH